MKNAPSLRDAASKPQAHFFLVMKPHQDSWFSDALAKWLGLAGAAWMTVHNKGTLFWAVTAQFVEL
jgi:hypothetical protein